MSAITQSQRRQISRFVSDAADKAIDRFSLDKDNAQRVIERGDELARGIRASVTALLENLSVSDKFKDEEVKSGSGYPSGYKPKDIAEQTNHLRELFPDIGYADEKLVERELPTNAEGWFAIPRWEKIAPTYNEAVRKVLDMIKQTRGGKFYNYCDGLIGPEHLRQARKTKDVFQKLGNEQKSYNILVVPAQFGIRHRGRSVRRAHELFTSSEFGLGAFAVGIMLLTHPERLMKYHDLWIDCAGDEYDIPAASARFASTPYFRFNEGEVGFGVSCSHNESNFFGSASGFKA